MYGQFIGNLFFPVQAEHELSVLQVSEDAMTQGKQTSRISHCCILRNTA